MFRHNNNNDVRIYSNRFYECPSPRPVFLFHSKFQVLEESRCPLRKTRTVFLAILKTVCCRESILGNILRKSTTNTTTNPTLASSLWITTSLLFRDPELVKNILVKDFQNFMECQISTDEKTDPLWASSVFVKKGQRWREIRTNFTPLFTTGKMKTMFYLVNVCVCVCVCVWKRPGCLLGEGHC